jgi:hypothetical protein
VVELLKVTRACLQVRFFSFGSRVGGIEERWEGVREVAGFFSDG